MRCEIIQNCPKQHLILKRFFFCLFDFANGQNVMEDEHTYF